MSLGDNVMMGKRERGEGRGTIEILGCSVSKVSMDEALDNIERWIELRGDRCRFVVATGFHGIWEAYKDPQLRAVLNGADLFCPDGIAPVWISRMRGTPLAERVPGPELLARFAARAHKKNYRSYFYGDTEETLAALKNRLACEYPGHRIAGTLSPPFRDLQADEERAILERINEACPDVLWVGLGLPKQERWIHRNRDALKVPVVVGVGAAFRLVSGRVTRAPAWLGAAGMEWIWRLAMEPTKLWRRDLVDGPRFLYRALAETLQIRMREAFAARR